MADLIDAMKMVSSGWSGFVELLYQEPGRFRQLIGRHFEVVRPWPGPGVQGSSGRPVLEAWPVGMKGQVTAVTFAGSWKVRFEPSDMDHPMSDPDEFWPEISIAWLFRCTEALDVDRRLKALPDAANDD